MMNTIYKSALFFCFSLSFACNHVPMTPHAEISDPDLQEIAVMRPDPNWAAAVIYNPVICKEIGKACGFLRLHAYAHYHLNHTLLVELENYPTSLETQADCWAAQNGDPKEVYAAAKLFMDKNRNPAWKLYGDLEKRAETLRICYNKKGNWAEIENGG